MKNIFLLIFTSLIFVGCKKESKISMTFNTEPATKFIDLIDFIEQELNVELDTIEYSKNEIITNYSKNKNNKILNKKVDELLKLPTYKKLSEITSAYTDTSEYKGTDALKFAFLNLPYNCTTMTGGVAESWFEYWKNDYNIKAIEFISELKINSKRIKNESIKLSQKYFPNTIKDIHTVKTVFCIDGNRGSFTSENVIYMDILGFTDFNINSFTKVLSHELHHVIYSNWLNSRFQKKSEKEKAIFKLQSRIILEGVAQQINFIDYNSQVKEMYNSKELLNHLYKNFAEALIELKNSDKPLDTYYEFNSKMWNESSHLLEKYCNGKIEFETIPRRPTYEYYLSYKIYESIEKNGGKEKLQFVLNHPENLLVEFNRSWHDKSLLPKFPLEIVELWKNNIK